MSDIFKQPRIFIDKQLFGESPSVPLEKEQVHYLKNVLRLNEGDQIRLFNGQDGEWLAHIQKLDKKSASILLDKHIKTQPNPPEKVHLLFAPIKKQRMDFLIEKAVELGVTDLTPVITDHTENRNIKPERIKAQIIEAAEQCERLDIPHLNPEQKLSQIIQSWSEKHTILWCAERTPESAPLTIENPPCAFLIGPEGGFSKQEFDLLKSSEKVTAISLGERIMRAETAALYCLSHTNSNKI